jgi:hypothetical protein
MRARAGEGKDEDGRVRARMRALVRARTRARPPSRETSPPQRNKREGGLTEAKSTIAQKRVPQIQSHLDRACWLVGRMVGRFHALGQLTNQVKVTL